MNRRTFLFGLGVGIILGAGLLQLMLIGEKQAEGLNALPETKAEIKTYSQADLDKAIADERERVRAELQPKTATDNAEPSAAPGKAADKPAAGAEDGKAGKPSASAGEDKAAEPARTIVRIPPNASVSETAELLADRGIIADKQAFIDLMRSNTIRAGYFSFQGKPTLQQVRGIVTGQPLDPETAKRELDQSGNDAVLKTASNCRQMRLHGPIRIWYSS
ncbi:hypothetical protein SAMN02799624_01210 [Paenibacillus sp. UNC496MF]|uniref:hypothetical protein n=1 Tax=Paenibacillus sp. UNC496MF TaxID=1502753 RepID=UPI0008E88D23|nr:hypothetical protein [Paenibacillus sp. UNC496MF]SFI52701.1 hypothetical protein SAMN02799624_01210 [Paenibacillus sp. UNC496MF]